MKIQDPSLGDVYLLLVPGVEVIGRGAGVGAAHAAHTRAGVLPTHLHTVIEVSVVI